MRCATASPTSGRPTTRSSWVARDPVEGALDGEIDFVLCHPDEGIVCLEVKGGGIECQNGKWFWVTKDSRKPMKDPFKQALDHRYDLERLITTVDGWRGDKLLIAHGLAFPYITIHQLNLAPDAPREILADRNELKEPTEAIGRMLAFHAARATSASRPAKRAPRCCATSWCPA